MGKNRLMKYVIQSKLKEGRIAQIAGNTKKELTQVLNVFPKDFVKGEKVFIYRQTKNGVGSNKCIIIGNNWTLPKTTDDQFSEK